jgi:hypothetical protein
MMVNNRKITRELLNTFKNLGVKGFVVGHTHFRSGDIDHEGSLITICSSDIKSPTAGHYMYQEMVVEAQKVKKKDNKEDKRNKYCSRFDYRWKRDIRY